MKLLLFTIISLCFLNVKAQNFRLPTDVQQHQLNGKVKKVKEIIAYEMSFFSAVDTVFYSFDKNGFIAKSEPYKEPLLMKHLKLFLSVEKR